MCLPPNTSIRFVVLELTVVFGVVGLAGWSMFSIHRGQMRFSNVRPTFREDLEVSRNVTWSNYTVNRETKKILFYNSYFGYWNCT